MSVVTSCILIVRNTQGRYNEGLVGKINAWLAENHSHRVGAFERLKECCEGGSKGLSASVYTAGLNYVDWDAFLHMLANLKWGVPEWQHLVWEYEHDEPGYQMVSMKDLVTTHGDPNQGG